MLDKVSEVESWMASNPHLEASDYKQKQEQLERIYNPVATSMYQGAAAASNAGTKYC